MTKQQLEVFQHESRWSAITLRQQVAQLRREEEHLRLKSLERPLTSWEYERIDQILDEMMQLLQEFGGLANARLAVAEGQKSGA